MDNTIKAAIMTAVEKALQVPLPESQFAVEFKSVTARVSCDKNTRKRYADACANYSLRTFAGCEVGAENNSSKPIRDAICIKLP